MEGFCAPTARLHFTLPLLAGFSDTSEYFAEHISIKHEEAKPPEVVKMAKKPPAKCARPAAVLCARGQEARPCLLHPLRKWTQHEP